MSGNNNQDDTLECGISKRSVFNLGVRKIALEMFKKSNRDKIQNNYDINYVSNYLPNLKNKQLKEFIPILLDVKRLGDRAKIEYVKKYNEELRGKGLTNDYVFLATTDILEFCIGILRNCHVILERPNDEYFVHDPTKGEYKFTDEILHKFSVSYLMCSLFLVTILKLNKVIFTM